MSLCVAAGTTAAMPDDFRLPFVQAHIQHLAERRPGDAERLTAAIVRRCWPGGSGDRAEPAAIEWLRRWGTTSVAMPTRSCACAQGCCAVCN